MKKFLLAAWGKWWVKTLLIIALLLIIIRIILSPVATKLANNYLGKQLPGYYGQVDDIRFALFRGAYKVDRFYLNKVDSITNEQTLFVAIKLIDLSLEWKALFQGKLAGKMFFDSPVINFTKDKVEPSQVIKDTATFKQMLDIGMPLDINRFEIQHGQVHYQDSNASPVVDIYMNDIYVLAENLRNTVDPDELLPAAVHANATVYGGSVDLKVDLNLLADYPTFDLKAECTHLNLPDLNSFFKAYGKFTVEKGDFSVFSEVAAKDGDFKGYVKPLIKDLKILGPDDKDEKPLIKLWEGILTAVAWVFENKKEDQLATKIPLVGKFDNPRPNIIYTIYELLKNAFIQALNPSLDYEININSVGDEDDRTSGEKFKDKMKGRKERSDRNKEEKKNIDAEKEKGIKLRDN